MHDHQSFRTRIEEILDRLIEEESALLADISPELDPLVEQMRRSLSGGKRLRAAFFYWGWRGARQPDCPGILRAAAAMELVHAAAVVHDDIIDASPTRHHQATAHIALAQACPLPNGQSPVDSHTGTRGISFGNSGRGSSDLLGRTDVQLVRTAVGLPGAGEARLVDAFPRAGERRVP